MEYCIILHRGSLFDLYKLIHQYPHSKSLLVICSEEKITDLCHSYIEKIKYHVELLSIVKHYDTSFAPEVLVTDLVVKYRVVGLLAFAEFDMMRASHLRKSLSIPGLSPKAVQIFRNKIQMKQHFLKAEIKTAQYRSINNWSDLNLAAQDFSFPFIFKHQESGGGVGTVIIKDEECLRNLACQPLSHNAYIWPAMMAESFVQGDMFHVDALIYKGEPIFISIGKYAQSRLSYMEEKALSNLFVDPTSRIGKKLVLETKKAVLSVIEKESYAIHAEFFVQPNTPPILCEIACRPGGGAIMLANKCIRQVDMGQWLLAQEHQKDYPLSMQYVDKYGGAVMPPIGQKSGILKVKQNSCPVAGVKAFHLLMRDGTHVNPAISYMQVLAYIVFAADSFDHADEIRKEIEVWASKNFSVIEDG